MEAIEKVLKELWENDDSVPAAVQFRCTELDWFSQGIKDNIVAYIACRVLGTGRTEVFLQITINKAEVENGNN